MSRAIPNLSTTPDLVPILVSIVSFLAAVGPAGISPLPDPVLRDGMVSSSAMRKLRSAAGRWGGQLSSILLLVGLSAAAVVPHDVVWCRGTAGHNALEPAWSTCCTAENDESSYTSWCAPSDSWANSALQAPSAIPCEDVWLGVIGAAQPTTRPIQHEPGVVAAALDIPSIIGAPVCQIGPSVTTPHLCQVRELISSTVLTI